MLDRSNPYFRQVELVVRVLPLVASEHCFALKGGTAINLFICDFPRLSVDIDLTYLPLDDRDNAFGAIEGGLGRIADKIRRVIQGAKVTAAAGEAGRVQRLQIAAGGVSIKVEVVIFRSGPDNQSTRCPIKTTPDADRIPCDTRITRSYSRPTRRGHCGKVARKTPPCERERGRWNPVVLESAEGVTQDRFLTQRSAMTGSTFEPSRYRIVRVTHLQIRPACYGYLFNNRC